MSEHPLAQALGGEPYTATLRSGETQPVHIRELTVRQLTGDPAIIDDEPAFVELLCAKPKGWADGLTLEAHSYIMEKGWALNRPTMEAWLTRRKKRSQDVGLSPAR
jgi:hypothetical protein